MNATTILITLSLLAAAWGHGNYYANLEHASALNKAVAAAIEVERNQQKGVNDAVQKQADTVRFINSELLDDIAKLHNRPSRVPASVNPGAACAGANGLELAREHAQFLAGFAALAAEQDAALAGCYSAYDAVK